MTARGVGTENIVKVSGKIRIVMDLETARPTCELASKQLSSESGFLVRTMAPHQAKKWMKIDLDDKKLIMTRLLSLSTLIVLWVGLIAIIVMILLSIFEVLRILKKHNDTLIKMCDQKIGIGYAHFLLVKIIRSLAQILGYKGIAYTSPTLASAISNITPAFTFTLAVIFRRGWTVVGAWQWFKAKDVTL
ncbi:hypothetical protein Pint_02664 [Pistacia integerrima]|uniref:Uncharacterized protein n=1 Tax=Pistacia integerrima TaxID=434235 RepID=A0ACC0ZL26_9ROSI|nr:hypothetical protein Pint_02664 [Pistacia integerrima]